MPDKFPIPELPDEFPEEDFLRDGPMRDEIIVMLVEALNRQGYPDLDSATIRSRPEHREAALDMLGDCRPLPIVNELIAELRRGADG